MMTSIGQLTLKDDAQQLRKHAPKEGPLFDLAVPHRAIEQHTRVKALHADGLTEKGDIGRLQLLHLGRAYSHTCILIAQPALQVDSCAILT